LTSRFIFATFGILGEKLLETRHEKLINVVM